MVSIHLEYQGDLRVKAIHDPSQTKLITDAPVDNHGKGESFSPTDLVATGLGACMATIMGIVAQRHNINLTGMKIHVVKEMITQPKRRIGKLKVQFQIPFNLSEKEQKLLTNAALTCPVHQSLHPEIEVETEFEWGHS